MEPTDLDGDFGTEDSMDRAKPIQVQVEAIVLLSDGQKVRVRDRSTVDLLDATPRGVEHLFQSIRRRLIRACNIAGANAQDVFGRK